MVNDIYGIFENMPTSTVIYSPIFGDCEFERIGDKIWVSYYDAKGKLQFQAFDKYFGCFANCNHGKMMIFPDAKSENWDNWQSKLLKKGDYISDYHYETLIYIGNYEGYTSDGKILPITDLYNYTYSTAKQKEDFDERLKNEGYKWNASKSVLEQIVLSPIFKINDVIKLKGEKDNTARKICNVTNNKYYFDDNTFAYIYDQDKFEFVKISPIFKEDDIIKHKTIHHYFKIKKVTDRGYVLYGHPLVLFESQNEWESIGEVEEDYCSYDVCERLKNHGFVSTVGMLEKYGIYSGVNHDIVKPYDDNADYDENDVVRIPQSIAIKWIRQLSGLEIGATPIIDHETGKAKYVPYVKSVNLSANTFKNEMSYKDISEVETYSGAVDNALTFALTHFFGTLLNC